MVIMYFEGNLSINTLLYQKSDYSISDNVNYVNNIVYEITSKMYLKKKDISKYNGNMQAKRICKTNLNTTEQIKIFPKVSE